MAELILGFLLGLAAAPILRSWMVWREYREARRERDLAEDLLRHMDDERPRPSDGASAPAA